MTGPDTPRKQPEFEPPSEPRLHDALRSAGLDPVPQFPLAGRRLDLGIAKGEIRLDMKGDGDTYHRDPDGFRKLSDHWRDPVIRSLGWRVRRFRVYHLRDNMESCVERVSKDLG